MRLLVSMHYLAFAGVVIIVVYTDAYTCTIPVLR